VDFLDEEMWRTKKKLRDGVDIWQTLRSAPHLISKKMSLREAGLGAEAAVI
jgi:hypothetical protein